MYKACREPTWDWQCERTARVQWLEDKFSFCGKQIFFFSSLMFMTQNRWQTLETVLVCFPVFLCARLLFTLPSDPHLAMWNFWETTIFDTCFVKQWLCVMQRADSVQPKPKLCWSVDHRSVCWSLLTVVKSTCTVRLHVLCHLHYSYPLGLDP